MTSALSSIGLPHWLMIAGGLLVVLGFVGLSVRRESIQVEPDAIAGGREIFNLEGDQAQAEDTIAQETVARRDRWAERSLG